MSTLNKYLRILSRLNYSNISTKFSTTETLAETSSGKEHFSQLSLSLVTPVGKPMVIRCAGRNVLRDLAEKEAVRYAVTHLSKHCFDSGIHHLNQGNEFNSILEEANQNRYSIHSKNLFVKELPFFNEECVLPSYKIRDNNITLGNSLRVLSNYQGNCQNLEARRHYSKQLSSGDLNERKTDNDLDAVLSSDCFDKQYADILKKFPAPKNFIGNIYYNIQQSMNSKHELKSHKMEMTRNRGWLYTLNVSWPENGVFKGYASTKKEAGRRAAVLCIDWLQRLGKVDGKGRFVGFDKNVTNQETKKSSLVELKVNNSHVAAAEELIANFSESKLEEKLKKQLLEWQESNIELSPDFTNNENINSNLSASLSVKRNRELYNRLQMRQKSAEPSSKNLPISPYRDKICDLIRKNQVLIVKGEPGCGKSTQVPQMLIDDFTEKMKATDLSIVVTQPRRISAITLSERVASERGEMVGDVVGYHVRLDSKIPHRGRASILFCSTGVMLRKLLSNPDMQGISHVIIDEAHERDLNTDLMLLLTKRAAARNPNLKIVIMSATINPELFQNYFDNSVALYIPGFTYPVISHFLDANLSRITKIPLKPTADAHHDFPVVDVKAIARLVGWIDKSKPPGAILVFLPGWAEISQLRFELDRLFGNFQLEVLPIHSRMSHFEQRKIFDSPPYGKRKVILATNIAETSITINDVNYVIDSGAHKEERLNSQQGTLAIDNQWVSQASARQRRGRAGRVGPGECYHLYTREKFESFDKFPLPEVHRIRLESTVLNSKVYSGSEKAEEFLKQLPEPPSTEVIRDAVKNLQWAGALDEDEHLTPLGTRISVFTTDPFISKALVHSYLFKCVNPMITIGTIMSSDVELFPGTMGDKATVRDSKKKFSLSSDHLALALMFDQWENCYGDSNIGDKNRAYNHYVDYQGDHTAASTDALRLIGKLRHLVGQHLYQCGLLELVNDYKVPDSDCNRYSSNPELLKGVLLSGLGNVLTIRNWDGELPVTKKSSGAMTESGQRATISRESVNYKRTLFPSPFMTYFTEVRSQQQRSLMIRDTSIISPLTLLLFQCASLSINKVKDSTASDLNPNQIIISVINNKSNKKTLHVVCDERTAQAIIKLRRIMWSITGYLVREKGYSLNLELFNEVTMFHGKMLSLLDKMLMEQVKVIDYEDARRNGERSRCN